MDTLIFLACVDVVLMVFICTNARQQSALMMSQSQSQSAYDPYQHQNANMFGQQMGMWLNPFHR